MYSSHSATPVFGLVESVFAVSPVFAGAVVAVVLLVVVVVAVFAGLFAVEFEAVFAAPPQPNETKTKHAMAVIAKKLLILIFF
jgi:hypothetical protein